MAMPGSLALFCMTCITFILTYNLHSSYTFAQVLTPPYFNLAEGRKIQATATCGVEVPEPELFCRLTGAISEHLGSTQVIQGQLCDYCDQSVAGQSHPPEYAIDGTQRWWQSPPLSRSMDYNAINLTVNLGQEFHVAYVYIKMANAPRPGVWALERSTDFGKTWKPWQYFADTESDCLSFFNTPVAEDIDADDQILCTTEFSQVVPLTNGEIVVSLVNHRPNAENFSSSITLQNWTKATNVRLHLIRTKTLLGHLMALARQDPTVTRRYYYSIKDISIGGRCVCNGHADTCDKTLPDDPETLLCNCQHNTCGDQCEYCCPGYVQKKWKRVTETNTYICEECQCYGHTTECVYDEEVDIQGISLDIHGIYEGGGVCQNCQDNTEGINCERCMTGYYRPFGVPLNSTDVCQPCNCDLRVSTGDCEPDNGRCLCRPEYTGEYCDRCSRGYYGYPSCIPCDCNFNGTEAALCEVGGGQCPCKSNYVGRNCDMCAFGFYQFPDCLGCACSSIGSVSATCNVESGQCQCQNNYGSRDCSICADGYYGYPDCDYCECDPTGTEAGICNKDNGLCMCKENFDGNRCDRCAHGYFNYPYCQVCNCSLPGSIGPACAEHGQCRCQPNFGGRTCGQCAPGFYNYPQCSPCKCDPYGARGVSCDQETGECRCRYNYQSLTCNKCKEGFYNYPICEECNCNPAGAKEVPGYPLGGCGSVSDGRLCECKDRVRGRICDICKPGYWNLNITNPLGCQKCQCFSPGTVSGSDVCNVHTGQCLCKPDVSGTECRQCHDGSYNLQEFNPFGCIDCNCDVGGSAHQACDKITGQCICKPRINGRRCESPIATHYFPVLHHHQRELEDGTTPRGTKARYDFNERVFPGYSWRGYVVLSRLQPEIQVDVYITKPSLYRLLYRYVNRNENTVRGEVILTPEMTTDVQQTSSVVFTPSRDPKFVTVSGNGVVSTFVLNPGKWTISLHSPESIFLDYLVLLPQAYYEAAVLQEHVLRPCKVPNDPGPCLHYSFPPTDGFSTTPGSDGYIAKDQQRVRTQLYEDEDVLSALGIGGMGLLDVNQKSYYLDLLLPDPGEYVLLMSYYNPVEGVSQELSMDIATRSWRKQGRLNLYHCTYSTLCRQVVMGSDGTPAIFNITSGYVSVTINGMDDVNVAVESIIAIPKDQWRFGYIRPTIVCIRVNGVCVESHYSNPVGSVRIDFEDGDNEQHKATDLPSDVKPDIGLVKLDSDLRVIEINGSVRTVTQHVFVIHFHMPSEPRLDIDASVEVNGQVIKGNFRPEHCSNLHGCRATISFDSETNHILDLKHNDVKLVLNNTRGGDIWLDYALLIPANQYQPSILTIQPIDKSGDFIRDCAGDHFDIATDAQGFCRESVYTLTVDNNNGALQCDCNIDGSLSFECQEFGGQCECRPNVIGRDCSQCHTGFYGFPRCKPCNCPYGLCHPLSGQCICPPRVTGARCDSCLPETFGFDPLIGCEDCSCQPQGVLDGNLNCADNGQCSCLPNVAGRRCDTCHPGYHTFPLCLECDCDLSGTTEDICDQDKALCLCKEHVEGPRCDTCKAETYYLDDNNPQGCTKCFCFGTTSRCDSSTLRKSKISDMQGWSLTNVLGGDILEAGITIAFDSRNRIKDDKEAMYWVAPTGYLGNKLTSYGGTLVYTVLFTLPRDPSIETRGLIKSDVILTGRNMSIAFSAAEQPSSSGSFTMGELDLLEYKFHHETSRDVVTREQFMSILVNVESLYIRASYYTVVDEVRLSAVELDIALPDGEGDAASNVEQCHCPANYQGYSCEECASGYYRSPTGPYRGVCVPCQCNGHADSCDSATGECNDCHDNTMGKHCELCLRGYFGEPEFGGVCTICSCPLPEPSNNFADSCLATDEGVVISCECQAGYAGIHCDHCDPGYWGSPRQLGEICQLCDCSNNINLADPRSCDRATGACLMCINNSTGDYCDRCLEWWYGDAIVSKDCRPCTCDRCGTDVCNHDDGVCICRPNVIGADCEQCAPYFYGYDDCNGCEPCSCAAASVSPQCDYDSGQCECQEGVAGRRCDRCLDGYWNYGPAGCEVCACLGDGAVTCDPFTGVCQCLPGVTGERCDRCLPRWVLIPDLGCHECDGCVNLLLDELEILYRDIIQTENEMKNVTLGVLTIQRLNRISERIIKLQILLESLRGSVTVADLGPLEQRLKDMEHQRDSLQSRADQINKDVIVVQADAEELKNNANDMEVSIRDADTEVRATVEAVKTELMALLQDIQHLNLEKYVNDANEILNEIEARDFDAQNKSTEMENVEANKILKRAKDLQMRVEDFVNRTTLLLQTIHEEIEGRLYDLQNSSRYSLQVSQNTLDIVTKYQKPFVVETMRDQLIGLLADITDILDMAMKLQDDTFTGYQDTETAYSGLQQASSRLDSAIIQLQDTVNALRSRVSEVEPLVLKAIEHARSLEKQAMTLKSMYLDTKDATDGALKAANAYKDIAEAIKAALNASQSAHAAAESALDKSEGVGDKSAQSKQVSSDLLDEARSAFQHTRTGLPDRLNGAHSLTDQLADLNENVDGKLKETKMILQDLQNSDLSRKANAAANKAMNAQMQAQAAGDHVKDIQAQLPEYVRKAQEIPPDVFTATTDISRAEIQVKNIKRLVPDARSLLDTLNVRLKIIRNLSENVRGNLTQLKQRIERAQYEANQIAIGVKFMSDTAIQLRALPDTQRAGSYNMFSVFINSTQPDGLIMYLGPNQGARTSDYMSLEVKDRKVVLRYDLTSGPAVITNPLTLVDGQWYFVEVEKIGKAGKLTVSTETGPNKSIVEIETVNGTSPGTYTVLDLNPLSTQLWMGGVSDELNLPTDVTQQMFTGEMEKFVFDEKLISMWNFIGGQHNNKAAIQRDIFLQEENTSGYYFNGKGYVVVPKKSFNPDLESQISITFKTYATKGLLLFMSKGRDFLSIELRDGKILYQFDLGAGRAKLMSTKDVNDGEFHTLEASRYTRDGILFVDTERVDGESPGTLTQLSVTDRIYVGGYSSLLVPIQDVTSIGFEGCIDELQFVPKLINLVKVNIEAKGILQGCPEQVIREITFAEHSRGYVAYEIPGIAIGSEFDITFKMKTQKNNSLLAFTTSKDDQGHSFSIAVVGGRIRVTTSAGDEPLILESEHNTYSDGMWHYISVAKHEFQLMLNVDDQEMAEEILEGSNEYVANDLPLYFGGKPYDLRFRTDLAPGLVGCIGDIVMKGGFINFATMPRKQIVGATFGCKLLGPGEETPTKLDGGISETEESTVAPATLPPGQCGLPTEPVVSGEPGDISGNRFGLAADSRHEFNKLPSKFRRRGQFSVEFRTTALHGLIFYAADRRHRDFISLYMLNGQVNYAFDCGTGSTLLLSREMYNDGKWHQVTFVRRRNEGTLQIDGEVIATGHSRGKSTSINVNPPFFVGGFSAEGMKKAKANIGSIATQSFVGCINNFRLNDLELGPPVDAVQVQKCYEGLELGTFFYADGGYITLYDNFKVGLNMDISLEIKPRSMNGVLIAVHSDKGDRADFLLMQMVDGELLVTTDNGGGAFTAVFKPFTNNELCDGRWHKVKASKIKNVLSLSVDGVMGTAGVGATSVSSADTNHPLYIGGRPADGVNRGVKSEDQYVGCIRNLVLNNRLQYLYSGTRNGRVQIDSCPKT